MGLLPADVEGPEDDVLGSVMRDLADP